MPTKLVSTSPLPIVVATDTPASAPIKLKHEAITIAWRGVNTFVETVVAIELAVSWNPLMYSNASATRITIRISSMGDRRGGYEYLSTTWKMMLPTSRQRSMIFSRVS